MRIDSYFPYPFIPFKDIAFNRAYDLFKPSQMTWRQDFILSLASFLKLNSCLPIPGSAGAEPSRNTFFRKPESRNSCCGGLWPGKAHLCPGREARRVQITGRKAATGWPGPAVSAASLSWPLSLGTSSDSAFVEMYQSSRQSMMPLDQLRHGAYILRGMTSTLVRSYLNFSDMPKGSVRKTAEKNSCFMI